MNQQRAVDRWNESQPVGSPVTYKKLSGTIVATKTRTEAQLLPCGRAVVFLEGVHGCYALDKVSPLELPKAEPMPSIPKFKPSRIPYVPGAF